MKRILFLIILLCSVGMISSQNTVGLLSNNDSLAYPGYNLFFPHNQANVILLDNCGRIVHQWTDDSNWRPGNIAYLLENGKLIRGKRWFDISNDSIWAGGGGEFIDILDWDGNVEYSFKMNDSLARLHHDFAPMPNGNILAIAWEYVSGADAIQAGRDSATMARGRLWPDMVIEIDPVQDSIVWEWHSWDHLVQDFDSTRDNYGDVGAHPELIDLNYDTNNGSPDWHHMNTIDYNADLDQIVLSVPQFDEIWIIDHSTTTSEASGHTGGNSGMGGDLIYRWGNPLAYRAGTVADQKLYYQHDIHWLDDIVSPTHPDYGKFAVFNNRWKADISTVNIFEPVFDSTTYKYAMSNGQYLPVDFETTRTHPDSQKTWSTGLSSVQLLPNDNLLITVGRTGYNFELTPEDEVVWEYVTPKIGLNTATQGDTLTRNANLTFRMKRFPVDFPVFAGKDLSPKGWMELSPDSTFCGSLILNNEDIVEDIPHVYPNPAQNYLNIEWTKPATALVLDMQGRELMKSEIKAGVNKLNIEQLKRGIYFLRVGDKSVHRFVVHK